MTLQRIVGAVVLSTIFIILSVLLLWDSGDDKRAINTSGNDTMLLEKVAEERPIVSVSIDEDDSGSPPPVPAEMTPPTLTLPKPVVVATQNVGWFLQIASFVRQENAKQLVKDLKQKGIEANYDMAISQKGQLYRVRTSAKTNKDHVEKTAAKIKHKFNIDAQLLRRTKK